MSKKILIVDDSALMRRVMCDIINSDGTFQVTDTCRDGLEAYEKLKTTRYDGVVLDVNMPRMDGLQLLEQLQKDRIRATVIMVSTTTTKDADVTIRAMERGAVDFVTKPTNVIEAKGEEFKKQLLDVLSAVCATQSYNRERRIAPQTKAVSAPAGTAKPVATAGHAIKSGSKIVALACSTGGPKALQSVIPYLPKNLDAPMVLVQHMPAGFTNSMAVCQHHVRFPAGLRLRSGCMRGSHRNGCGRHQGDCFPCREEAGLCDRTGRRVVRGIRNAEGGCRGGRCG